MKPICVPCHRFFRCKKIGYAFTEGMPKAGRPAPGTSEPENWQPYKVWGGDLYECQGCGAQVVVGVAREPIAEHYEANFKETQLKLGANQLQVNDC